MKYLAFFLALLVLAGCGAAPVEPSAPGETTLAVEATVPETTPPATVPLTEEEVRMQLLQFQLNAMSREEKVGQLILARCPEDAVAAIEAYHLSGLVLFGRDVEEENPDSLGERLSAYQSHSYLPMVFAVDEEGGTVARLSAWKAFRDTPFPSPRRLFGEGGMEAVLLCETEKARLLKSCGITVNLGPVCDIARDPGAFMYARSLGQDAQTTAQYAADTVAQYRSEGVGTVLKHFPGYGEAADTHTGMAVDERPLEQLEGEDLIPFRAGIDAGAGAIMVSHSIVTAFDAELPASLSPAVHSYLRGTMGFSGVILTDDLYMQAISDTWGSGEAAVLAVLAGNDLICCTEYAQAFDAILEALNSGRIPEEQLDAAVLRVLKWKDDLGILFP